MRKQPGSPPEVTPKQIDKVTTQVHEYELITPLFGGGVTPGEVDPLTIIRGTEIRGHLRFWWRACHGGKFNGNLEEMKQAENKLWGAAYRKGEETIPQDEIVQITVETLKSGTAIEPFKWDESSNRVRFDNRLGIPPYAAFPLQPSEQQQQDRKLKEIYSNVTFRLNITFPKDQQQEIEAALWAWETFGGIGARTRRGFGALHLLTVNGNAVPSMDKTQVRAQIQAKLMNIAGGKYPEGLPHLSPNLQFTIITPKRNTPLAAWEELIGSLKDFRQARSKGNGTGRSLWPEPEAIRQITRRRDGRYHPLPHPRKFPRAAFGLPIIFHFKDKKYDPEDTTLEGAEEGRERLASPLILRPLACANNQFLGLALLLEGCRTSPGGLQLVEKNDNKHPVDSTLTPNEAKNIPVLNGETDVLKAFMNYLGGFTR